MTQKMNEMDNQRVVVHTFTKLEGVFFYLTPILKTSDIDFSWKINFIGFLGGLMKVKKWKERDCNLLYHLGEIDGWSSH